MMMIMIMMIMIMMMMVMMFINMYLRLVDINGQLSQWEL